ncbi:MAG: cell wall hydrolase [Bacillota bacterium]
MKIYYSACRKVIISLAVSLLFVLSLAGQALAASLTVIPGDTLWDISIRYGTTIEKLKAANNIQDDIIHPGQIIEVPQSTEVSRGSGAGNISALEFDILARIITAEAENQDYQTKVAVGAVVLNRVKSPLFPDSIRGVVYQIDQSGSCQFQPVLNGMIDRPASESAKNAAREALSGADPTNGALFFWESWVQSPYLNSRPVAAIMGAFTFTY